MTKTQIPCIPGCLTDHAAEFERDHHCAAPCGSAPMLNGRQKVEISATASRYTDTAGTDALVVIGLYGDDRYDEFLDMTPADARAFAIVLEAAANAAESIAKAA